MLENESASRSLQLSQDSRSEPPPFPYSSLLLHNPGEQTEEFRLIPHESALWPLGLLFCPQIVPSGPFLTVVPIRKYCAVYSLRFDLYHGMEEVIIASL
jgi:hypothetical protein